ncbi:MAG: NUDIX hydrolase [Syntrophobacterales bacterium]|nr:MAG: NUDIX hydrolase [Syntrophobacterales bacterium]
MERVIRCPQCGTKIKHYKNASPTVDIIIEVEARGVETGIVLIKRKNEPHGWALPGGFVDYGESLEEAAVREAKEETGLNVHLIRQFHTYSDPKRDPRFHTISTVYIARAHGVPEAKDDAQEVGIFNQHNLPEGIVFDHPKILEDYFQEKARKKEAG